MSRAAAPELEIRGTGFDPDSNLVIVGPLSLSPIRSSENGAVISVRREAVEQETLPIPGQPVGAPSRPRAERLLDRLDNIPSGPTFEKIIVLSGITAEIASAQAPHATRCIELVQRARNDDRLLAKLEELIKNFAPWA